MISTRQEIVIGAQIGQWQKNVAVSRETNTFRNNPDNLTRHAIDTQSLSYCSRRRAKLLPPDTLANEGHFRRARNIIAPYEITTDQRWDLQDRQIIRGDAPGSSCFRRRRPVGGREAHTLRPRQCEIGEAFLSGAPVEIIHVTDRA